MQYAYYIVVCILMSFHREGCHMKNIDQLFSGNEHTAPSPLFELRLYTGIQVNMQLATECVR